ncbi:hypothetical protein LK533_06355 [Sphingomonas sp. PL-96]|uniref:hypothetical protein n=1 Tax=Sphingomonas sp. PL-96 TaxID=2887201 RepID=UPI001E39E200|nr:hypothetical protein [Sphingomonas sp. PL-96]MCC2976294.1 hypothetical protein [Sphingomonas sp. PL-96]
MKSVRTLIAGAALAVATYAAPASAQFFFKSPDLSGPAVTGAEPGIVVQALPGATGEELRAALAWNLRAGLNVAALQCQFEPTLLTLNNYNDLLDTHSVELKRSYDVLAKYFERNAKTKKEGQTALDQFGTRVYSSFSTVSAQINFCQAAGEIGQEAVFTPKGQFGALAEQRMRKLRNSLRPASEQQFPGGFYQRPLSNVEPLTRPKCWKKGEWLAKRCGAYPLIG